MTRNKLIIIILSVTLIVIIALVLIIRRASNQSSVEISQDPPEVIQQEAAPLVNITNVPRIPDSAGGGIDTNSAEVKRSQQSLDRLNEQLPYVNTVTSPDGVEVEIVIPPVEILSNDWTLLVQIFGPDYQVPEEDPEYEVMKRAFLTGVGDVISFLERHDIERSEVIIQWGDRAVIGDRMQQWLKE